MAKNTGKKRIHIVSYTHWDREFRWEFERTRMRLVDCVDRLLEIMKKKKDYRSFLFDGQVTMLDDYLEIRPEKTDEIKKLAKDGRLELGPWYTLADCAPIQGESVVRNILYGVRKSKEYGHVLKCGYNVFSFGQIAQLPQIYANFGIDTILFYKHMDPKKSKYHEFIWEAPDGTRALTSRLGREARWNFFFAGHIPLVYDKDAWHKDWQFKWGELGKVFHTADPEGYGWFYDILDPETNFKKENLRMAMDRTLKTVEGTAAPEAVLFFDGTDFTEPHPLMADMIKALKEEYKDEYDVIHSTLKDYLDDIKGLLKDRKDLAVVKGPMRDGPVGAIHTDVFSTHPEIMIENSHAENRILRWAEPLSAISMILGIENYPSTYFEKIWKLMFQSHAHDSMHGLGPKTLAEGEMSRLKQAHVIAQGIERRGLQNLTKEINTSAVTDTEFFLSVNNPSSFPRSEVVEAYVDVPRNVKLNRLVIEDMDGKSVQMQEVERHETRAGIYHPRSRNMPFYSTKVHLFFLAQNVPALGYKTFKIKWTEKNEYPYPHEDWDAPQLYALNMISGPNEAENEFIRVKINTNGTFDVTDKKTGRTYASLNYFLDHGDQGNMWMSSNPGNDSVINSLNARAKISTNINGPLAVSFTIEQTIQIPAELDWIKHRRSDCMKEIPLTVKLLLKKGSPYLEVETSLTNTARDHYLKVCFPTGLKAEKTWSEGSFSVTEFPVRPTVTGEMRGNELARHPAQLWFDLSDGRDGLAILSDAAKDYEILENDSNGTMAMGLVRSVRLRIPCDNRLWMEYPGDESSQSLGTYSYRYAVMPHKATWEKAGLYNQSLAFNTPMKACQFGKQKGLLPVENSFLEIEGDNIILSSVKKAEDRNSVMVRFYNPTNDDKDCVIRPGFKFQSAYQTKLSEERLEKLSMQGNVIRMKAGKGKILTIEFKL